MMPRSSPPQHRPQPRRKHIKVQTPEYLSNVALYYLSRFAASEASLRRVLENRLRRAAMAHPSFADDKAAQENLRQAIDTIVAQHKRTGVLDDVAYADMKVRSQRRSGRSARRITQQLQLKGIAAEIIAAALKPNDDEENGEDAERKAALAFARRRGLGPFRKSQKDLPDNVRRKDFATMARAGFAYDTTRDVLGGEPELEE